MPRQSSKQKKRYKIIYPVSDVLKYNRGCLCTQIKTDGIRNNFTRVLSKFLQLPIALRTLSNRNSLDFENTEVKVFSTTSRQYHLIIF